MKGCASTVFAVEDVSGGAETARCATLWCRKPRIKNPVSSLPDWWFFKVLFDLGISSPQFDDAGRGFRPEAIGHRIFHQNTNLLEAFAAVTTRYYIIYNAILAFFV